MTNFSGVRVDHHVDVIAVQGVEPHAQSVSQYVVSLGVPSESVHAEAMHECHEAPAPVGNRHVEGIDSVLCQSGRAPLNALRDAGQPRRVDDSHGTGHGTRRQCVGKRFKAQPHSPGVDVMIGNETGYDSYARDVLDVDAERTFMWREGEKVLERRNVARELVSVDIGERSPERASTQHAVVDEHNMAILCHPGVGLQTVRAQFERKGKSFHGVLRGVCAGAAMSECQGVRAQRGKPLLHRRRLCGDFYAGNVFNLSGSEIMFLLLAGLVVLGPDRLPGAIRRAGRTYAEVRRTVREYEKEFRETFKEPLKEVQSTVNEVKKSFGTVDTSPSPPMRPERAIAPESTPKEPGQASDD